MRNEGKKKETKREGNMRKSTEMKGETNDKPVSVTTFIATGLSSTELSLSHFCTEIFSILQVRRAECQDKRQGEMFKNRDGN